ncbi:hypothetical protein WJX72_004691 [[Myrmecia] bisecta]|uniref:N-acetyltransferase domain-containing protein n=1 Tax=[Myrmecia] bisecta TaxID=41462 RepID=A0AAW1PYB2_9CHLO
MLGVVATAAAEGISLNKAGWAVLHEGTLQPPPISKTDEQFASDNVQFVEGYADINLAELNDLFEKVGFPRRDPAKLLLALEHTHSVMWIQCTKSSRWAKLGQMLGFARATSDGALSATIWDVAVNPSWQRVGLGRAVIERLTARLVTDGISTVTLYAEPNVVGLYEKLGFVRDPDGIRGMAFQRKSKTGKALIERTNRPRRPR